MIHLNIDEDEESGTTTIYLHKDNTVMHRFIIRTDYYDFDSYITAINDVCDRLASVKYSLFDICIAKLRSDIVKHKVFENYKISTFQVVNGARDTLDDMIRITYSDHLYTNSSDVCIVCKYGMIPLKNVKSINVNTRVCEQIVELVNELDYVINCLSCDTKNASN